jgi:two-component system sensor histidine kinase/response regulator
MKKSTAPETITLRQKAEGQLQKNQTAQASPLSEADMMKIIHELEVHRIELEMQNEELKRAIDIAEKATEKFTSNYDLAPMGYFTLDLYGIIFELNLNGSKMLGKERADLLNSNFKLFLNLDSLPVFNDFLQKVFETNSRQTGQVSLVIDGNILKNIYLEGIHSKYEHKCLLTIIDITDQMKAAKQVQNSEIRYRRLFETAKDGILILDADNGQIVEANPFIIEMLEYSREELLGKALWEIGVFRKIAQSKDAFIELQNKEYIRFEDMPLETKNGKSINVEFVSNVYLVDQTKVIQCNIRDITKRRYAEIKLKESEARLRELNATKDKFFSIIAHDLKNPFMAILGFSDLLAERITEKDYTGIEEYARIIHNSTQRILSLLTNLLQWASSQTGKMKFNPEPVEIVALINEVAELSKDAAQHKSITISIKLPHNTTIQIDKSMISSVLRNIISNAIKFTNPGGNINISARQKQDELWVTVSDNGVGMNKDSLDKLFRVEDSHSTPGTQNEKGTGLGLILCKEFVEKHKGKIWAESETGKGSSFHFTIPTI